MTPRSKPESCQGCACYSHGSDFSAIEGTGSSGVMLVGEASGEHEQRDQLPFRSYAPAGGVLERLIRRMGLTRDQFWITNVVRCRPKNNWLENAPWEGAAIAHCRPNLESAIRQLRPRAIVALGSVATRALTGLAGEALGVGHLAGYVLPLPNVHHRVPCSDCGGKDSDCFICGGTGYESESMIGSTTSVPVLPNFHPAYLRRGKASHHGVFGRILRRAVNIASGREPGTWMWNIDPESEELHARLNYQPRPSTSTAASFSDYVWSHQQLVVSYDIETSESASLDEDAREGFADTHIRLVQFAVDGAGAIALPWQPEFIPSIVRILASPNLKCGHNVWTFDNKVLRAAGQREGFDLVPKGPVHDTLAMFHHWQPDLPAHLQFAAGFVQFPFPWKHLAASDIAFYGCCDVDATLRLYHMLEATLRRDGLYGDHLTGYIGQVYEVRPVLAAMEDRGMPIDDAERMRLGQEFDLAQEQLGKELADAAPAECSRVEPKGGFKKVPSAVADWTGDLPIGDVLFREIETASRPLADCEYFRYTRRIFEEPIVDAATGQVSTVLVERWCRQFLFNPNSSQQVKSYMRAKGHPIPKDKHREDADGNDAETTSVKELIRLANKTGDTFYLKVIEYRGLSKLKGTYVDGFKPGPDGCVHTTFTFLTGIGQLGSRNPNCFSADTELLTKRGWTPFPEVTEDDEVAQWHRTGSIDFQRPISLIKGSATTLLNIRTQEQIDMLLTANHECLYMDRVSREIRKIRASQYPKDAYQLQAGMYCGGDAYYSEAQVILMCALQADGHVMDAGHLQWGFSKKRKIDRLCGALDDLSIKYSTYPKIPTHGKPQTVFYISRDSVPEWLKDRKHFGSWLLDLDRESLDHLAEEIWFWDGHLAGRSMFSSSYKPDADWAQIVTILSNRRCKVRLYIGEGNRADNWQLDASDRNRSLTTNREIRAVVYMGKTYCVEMPQGTVIVRRNGRVAITGNCQNFPKLKPTPALAKAMRRMVRARPGNVLVEWDFKSCHIITLGFLAEDLNYMRLGRLDMHSFVAGHFLGHWDGLQLFQESDAELLARFKWLKSDPERKRVRDDQAKHGILGIGNGLKAKGLFERYMESFPPSACAECRGQKVVAGARAGRPRRCPSCKGTGMQSGMRTAERVLEVAGQLFPNVFKYQKVEARNAHEQQQIVSAFKHIRRFYEVFRYDSRRMDMVAGDQHEQAIAFRLANIAFGHIREMLKQLAAAGLDAKYGLFNNVHDSFLFHFSRTMLDEHIAEVYPILVAPSRVLKSKIAPEGLVIGVEGAVGECWAEMEELKVDVATLALAQAHAQTQVALPQEATTT